MDDLKYVFIVRPHSFQAQPIFGIFTTRGNWEEAVRKQQEEQGFLVKIVPIRDYEWQVRHYDNDAVFSVKMMPLDKLDSALENWASNV